MAISFDELLQLLLLLVELVELMFIAEVVVVVEMVAVDGSRSAAPAQSATAPPVVLAASTTSLPAWSPKKSRFTRERVPKRGVKSERLRKVCEF